MIIIGDLFISSETSDGIPLNRDALSVFKSLNNLYPESLKNVFKPTSGVHSYNVRGASNTDFVPRPSTEATKRAFSYRGQSCRMAQKMCLKTR